MGMPVREAQDAPMVPEVRQSDLSAINQALGALQAGKASAADLAVLVGAMAAKASAAEVANLAGQLVAKASAADLAVLVAAMPTKASAAALDAAVARIVALEGALATVPQFIASATMTVQELLANYPAAAPRRGKYVRVSNYGGYVDRVLRCDYDQGLDYHYWNPTQAEYGRSIPATADMTLKRLLSPTTVVLTGAIPLGTTRTVTIDTMNGRPGEIVEVKAPTFAGALNIVGTGLGSALAVASGAYAKYLIDGSGGSLSLFRLV